jgi:methyl-accepting chemotaxis protein
MNFLANIKIGQRLALGFAVVLVLSIITTAIGIVKLNAVADAAEGMLDEPVKAASASEAAGRGGAVVAQVVDTMGSIDASSKKIGDISAATEEQRAGIGQINDAVTQMDQVTQQNAALVEEAAAASAAMQDQARQLARLVGVFKMVDGARATPPQHRRAPGPALPHPA